MNALRRLQKLLTHLNRPSNRQQISRQLSTSMPAKGKTAAIIVIGDEILKGQTQDTNSHVICKKLYALGFKVKRAAVIPDDVAVIAEQVSTFSSSHDYVLTCGGVGPTHDDMTYEGVSKAFGLPMARHPTLVKLLEKYFGADHTHPAFKMAEVPETSKVLLNRERSSDRFPLVSVNNVYILPGIPAYMERSLNCLIDELERESTAPPGLRSIYVTADEVSITETLNWTVKMFESRVSFGSYPSVTNNYYRVRLTMESYNDADLKDAESLLREKLPQDSLVSYDADPLTGAADKLAAFLEEPEADPELVTALRKSVGLVEECLAMFGPDNVAVSFNGGKDCTAALHLFHSVLRKMFPDRVVKGSIKALYIKCEDPFDEMEDFIKETAERYSLKLVVVEQPYKSGLAKFLNLEPEVKAVLMGNRRTDPNSSKLDYFQMTDEDWPQVTRVLPLLDWTYKGVWAYLRRFSIPYCILYDQGYTSLGNRSNTTPHPKLQYTDSRGQLSYRPAYTLENGAEERNSRR